MGTELYVIGTVFFSLAGGLLFLSSLVADGGRVLGPDSMGLALLAGACFAAAFESGQRLGWW